MTVYPQRYLYIGGRRMAQTAAGSLAVTNPADGTLLGLLPPAGRSGLAGLLGCTDVKLLSVAA